VTITAALTDSTRSIAYTYDPLGRLVAADDTTGESSAYAYDAVGNRTVLTDTAGVHTYTYDAANRLTGVDGMSYTWDARGNLRSNGVFTYTYDGAGRMVRAESVSATVVYTYGLDSLLVGRSAGGAATTYAWDWATGVPEMLSDGERLYLIGQETLGWADGAEWSYPLGDALGSVRQVVDGAGEVLDDRSWTPFGVEEGTAQGGLGYTGEWWDAEVSLLYLRARWYDPAAGRFTQADTFAPELKNPQSLGRYAYALSNPLRYTDPTGHFTNEAIQGYLDRAFTFGSEEDLWWETWNSDNTWMGLLHTAQAGDFLSKAVLDPATYSFSVEHFVFEGVGQTELTGLNRVNGIGLDVSVIGAANLTSLYPRSDYEGVLLSRFDANGDLDLHGNTESVSAAVYKVSETDLMLMRSCKLLIKGTLVTISPPSLVPWVIILNFSFR
jgi:RHS repeat-associated protein